MLVKYNTLYLDNKWNIFFDSRSLFNVCSKFIKRSELMGTLQNDTFFVLLLVSLLLLRDSGTNSSVTFTAPGILQYFSYKTLYTIYIVNKLSVM